MRTSVGSGAARAVLIGFLVIVIVVIAIIVAAVAAFADPQPIPETGCSAYHDSYILVSSQRTGRAPTGWQAGAS